jgi:hypothetical protein
MADNYLQFSEVMPKLKKREEAWLKAQLQHVAVFGEKEYTIDPEPERWFDGHPDLAGIVPAELAKSDPDWYGMRFLRDKKDYDPDCDLLGFQYAFDGPEMPRRRNDRWGRHLWLYADENGNPDNVAHLVHKFLKQFRPNECWSLTWATTCSKPRVGEFGGGAIFVTAHEIRWENAYDFVAKNREAFDKRGKAGQKKAGKKSR